jgi:drug/metabolite transporter (DMT)-like permease
MSCARTLSASRRARARATAACSTIAGYLDVRTAALTLLALVAFAANSLLARVALESRQIDAASFTLVRLVSGAAVLLLIMRIRSGATAKRDGRPGFLGPLSLFCYAAPFSFAYLRVGAAVGALVLFCAVQLTMVSYGLLRGERQSAHTWFGLVCAVAGLALLTVPKLNRPDPWGIALMLLAGIAWGVYSLLGRTAPNPIAANAWSFLVSSAFAALLAIALRSSLVARGSGIGLALVSGAVTSGLGYAVWYRALPRLTVMQAAVAQLSVPVIAALGASLILGEQLTLRFVFAGAAILGGIGLVLSARSRVR